MRIPFWKTNWFRVAIGTFSSIVFLLLALKDVPLDEVGRSLARVNYLWVALAVLAMVAQSWLRAVRWIQLYYPLQKELRAVHKKIDETKLEVLTEVAEENKRDQQILTQQKNIIEYEENIMEKLDALRKK